MFCNFLFLFLFDSFNLITISILSTAIMTGVFRNFDYDSLGYAEYGSKAGEKEEVQQLTDGVRSIFAKTRGGLTRTASRPINGITRALSDGYYGASYIPDQSGKSSNMPLHNLSTAMTAI